MELIRNWLKQVIFCMCLLELLYQLVPQKTWQKYVRFTGGLIFMLVLMQPLFQMFSMEDAIRHTTWEWEIGQDSAMLARAQEELAELQNQQIQEELSRELERQITELAAFYGGETKEVLVTTEEQGSEICRVEILLSKDMEKQEMLKGQLAASFGLNSEQIIIRTAEVETE